MSEIVIAVSGAMQYSDMHIAAAADDEVAERELKVMKKKLVVTACVFLVIIVAVIVAFVYFKSKTDWVNAGSNYGPLNVMELESENETSGGNNTKVTFNIDSKKDIKITGQFHIKEGSVKAVLYMNDEKIAEQTFDEGSYNEEMAEVENVRGVVKIELVISDDVAGNYQVTVDTRETKWNRLRRLIKE